MERNATMLFVFLGFLAFFHVSEYALVWVFNPSELSRDSWLISKPYCLAMSLAVFEYLAESALFPSAKGSDLIGWTGAGMMVVGEGLRKSAILTAKSSFTLQIRTRRDPSERVVDHGVYRYCRHPGYLGWMMWCLGSQIFLKNPICFVIFAFWSWRFFAERIPYEEDLLLDMFGLEYRKYAQRTRVWIPFVRSPIALRTR